MRGDFIFLEELQFIRLNAPSMHFLGFVWHLVSWWYFYELLFN